MNYQNLKIDGYDIQEKELLGQGQYGRVYACKSLKQNEQNLSLCIKLMRVIDQKSANREAEILNLIKDKHPNNKNLVKILEVKIINVGSEQLMAIVMERCKTDLKKICAEKKVHTNQEVIDFLQQVLQGYQALYDGSFVHRDIKPENIMVNYENGKPIYKLADFGTGKKMEKKGNIMFQTAATGTPVYAPPEINQLAPEDPLLLQDSQNCKEINTVDIFSIGMILWQLLYGNFPFEPTYVGIQTFFSNLQSKQTIKTPNNPNVDKDLAQLIEKMVVYLPSKRITFLEVMKLYVNKEDTNSRASTTTSENKVQFPVQMNFKQKQSSDQQQKIQSPQAQVNFISTFPQNQQSKMNQQFPINQANQPNQFQVPGQVQNRVTTTPSQGPNQFKINFLQSAANPPQFNGANNAIQQNNLQQFNQQPQIKQNLRCTVATPQQFQKGFPNNNQQIQFQTPSQNLRGTMMVPQNNNLMPSLIQEIKDTFINLLDSSEILIPDCATALQQSLDNLNKLSFPQPQVVSGALQNVKNMFCFNPEKNYTQRYIRFLFIFTCITNSQDYSSQIQTMGHDQMKSLLTEWSKK